MSAISAILREEGGDEQLSITVGSGRRYDLTDWWAALDICNGGKGNCEVDDDLVQTPSLSDEEI